MLSKCSKEYAMGFITGVAIAISVVSLILNPIQANQNYIQQVEVVNQWPIKVVVK